MDSMLNSVLASCANTKNVTSTTSGTHVTTPSSKFTTNLSTSTIPLTPSTNGSARIFTNFTAASIIPSNPTSCLLPALTDDGTIIRSSSTLVPDFRAFIASFNKDITRSPKMQSMSSLSLSNESAIRVIPPPTSSIPCFPSTSTLFITSGFNSKSTPSSAAIPSSGPISLELHLAQVDIFMKAASIAAFKKYGINVSIVSCEFSLNSFRNDIKDFIYMNKEAPMFLLVPFLHGRNRIVLAAFNIIDERVGYFDSLKQPMTQDFWIVKYAVEKCLGSMHFKLADQNMVDSTINENLFPWLSTFHICRIAEQICFNNGKTQLLKPFNILDEFERIKNITTLVTTPNWDGEWLPTIFDARLEKVINDVIAGGGSINAKVEDDRIISSGATSVAGNIHVGSTQQHSRSSDAENIVQKTPFETLKKKFEVIQSSMDIYQQKYPVLSQMIKIYLNFMHLRFDRYKRNDDALPTIKKTFDFNSYIKMNHFDAGHGITMFKELPYFCDLSDTEKSVLIRRFRDPFLVFERIYDTLNTIGSTLHNKCIVLQNGDCFKLETLKRSSMPSNMINVFNIIFSAWEKLLRIVRMIDPDIVDAAYLFYCFLFNSSYLKTPISNKGEEMIRRGRLIIQQEMREYYEYDDGKWEKIVDLRLVMLDTEKFIQQYKERAVLDSI